MFTKLEPGDPFYLTDFPQMCGLCGSQKGPMVATGVAPMGTEKGQVYLCRTCVTQSARALGMVKGDEHLRLQNAADELAEAQRQIVERQELIDKYVAKMGQDEAKISSQKAYIETLQGEISTYRAQANQVQALAREMAA